MTRAELNNKYFDWLCQLVRGDRSYRKLLCFLYDTNFFYILDMDCNRAEDGAGLRQRFAYEYHLKQGVMDQYFLEKPCSVLEMMIALSIRCEEHIMCDSDEGDRTSKWFWGMVNDLGLGGMTDKRFDLSKAERIISRFLYRQYKPNGKGGLFFIKGYDRDLTTVEIWCQAMWYLDNVLQNRGW